MPFIDPWPSDAEILGVLRARICHYLIDEITLDDLVDFIISHRRDYGPWYPTREQIHALLQDTPLTVEERMYITISAEL